MARFSRDAVANWYLTEGSDGVNVRLRRREASPHRIHGHVAGAQGTPASTRGAIRLC